MKWPTKYLAKPTTHIPSTRKVRQSISEFISPPKFITHNDHSSISLQNIKDYMQMPLTELSPGLSQPVWGPEISTVGAYSREGYTSRSFDQPAIPFSTQAAALQQDEDIQLAMNRLSSQVTGGAHYITTVNEILTDYLEKFTKDMQFDRFDTILIKEMLWYGNSVWKPRMGIRNVQRFSDLMHIPISSFVRIWWDRQRQPYKLEFRGSEYQGYHNVGEVIHFTWNPVDASAFGTGFGVSATSERIFDMVISGDNKQQVTMPSMLDRKYAIQFIMQMASQRYVSRNVYTAMNGTDEDRAQLQSFVDQLQIGQDLVSGTQLNIQELGTNTRSFNPEEFTETVQSPIMKAVNDFSGKQGSESQATYANAETAKEEKETGLSAFTINAKVQLNELLFKPWYESNPYFGPEYMGGLIPVEWDDLKFELNFGAIEKKDIPIEQLIKLIEIYQNNPMLMSNVKPLLELYKKAGIEISDEDMMQMNGMVNDPGGQMAIDQANQNGEEQEQQQEDFPTEETTQLQLPPYSDMGGGEIFPEFNNQNMGSPPMDNSIYDSMARYPRGAPSSFVPTNFHQSNQSQDWNFGRQYETKRK